MISIPFFSPYIPSKRIVNLTTTILILIMLSIWLFFLFYIQDLSPIVTTFLLLLSVMNILLIIFINRLMNSIGNVNITSKK